jgi:Tfp pilus assembly protein PilZ
MVARRVPRQVHPRYNTNVLAQIESMVTGNPLLTSMYNLSKGGAYCEFDSDETFTVGDLVKLKVNLEDTKSDYDLSAKVIWTVKKGRFSGRFGCGFKFVSTQDAYHSLISKL